LQKIRTPKPSELYDGRKKREERWVLFFLQTLIENKAGSSPRAK